MKFNASKEILNRDSSMPFYTCYNNPHNMVACASGQGCEIIPTRVNDLGIRFGYFCSWQCDTSLLISHVTVW